MGSAQATFVAINPSSVIYLTPKPRCGGASYFCSRILANQSSAPRIKPIMNTEEQQTEVLLGVAGRGDRNAFGQLVEVHSQQVFFRATNNEPMVENAVQETFIKA